MYSIEMMIGIRNILLVQMVLAMLLLPGASTGLGQAAARIKGRLFAAKGKEDRRRPSSTEQAGDFCEIDMSKFDE
ncbi:MAG: hypothetical protein A2X56_05660 [Nitrospirae bacterium GWC2_57_13]|jgi:hypothetical protein|nr:MAG: hypothetical protein A2072_06150 [Nitrospirae bacterium GWC1_57_7]OGW29905.1 MAG: hypothetical protein A2X56_05660 [Nitrospirae bacterium GWC2_57_13]OGW43888.1 MAG: hypothetical protein A2X57_00530 [Nitrospirae bacterium GWD2_57_8]HAR45296.1 hypothetical protein [Nitrospiraceae bacterium]